MTDRAPTAATTQPPLLSGDLHAATIVADDRLHPLIERFRAILADRHLVEILRSDGIQILPRLLATSVPEGPRFGLDVLHLVIAWKFVSRLINKSAVRTDNFMQ